MPKPAPERSASPNAAMVPTGAAFFGVGAGLALGGQFWLHSVPVFGAGIGVLGAGIAYIAMSILRTS